MPLILAAPLSVFVWLVPLNEYDFDGPSGIPPNPDAVLVIVLFAAAGLLAAVLAAWRSRRASPPAVRWTIAAAAAALIAGDVVRLWGALPHFEG